MEKKRHSKEIVLRMKSRLRGRNELETIPYLRLCASLRAVLREFLHNSRPDPISKSLLSKNLKCSVKHKARTEGRGKQEKFNGGLNRDVGECICRPTAKLFLFN